MPTLFISDLHLDGQRPAIVELFSHFLQQQATQADALYILGDLFEAWIGDDDDSELAQHVAQSLSKLNQDAVPVYFIHGNRDFLLGQDYAVACQMQLLNEAVVIDLYGQPTLVMHGDTLCTDDVEYQVFRTQARSAAWQQHMLALSLEQRREQARQLRQQSQQATRLKAEDITDVNQAAVEQAMREQRVQHLIHGHTHRPAQHDFQLDGKAAQRIVLGEWYEQGSVLVCDEHGCRLQGLQV